MTDTDFCEVSCVHEDAVKSALSAMPDMGKLFDLAELFKMLGDTTRVRILSALILSELCVCDLAAVLGMERTAVSHQLRLLRASRLIRARRDGKMVYYSLDDGHVELLFKQGFEHINENG